MAHNLIHRGLAKKNFKENTLKAFKYCFSKKYGIETDLHCTKDNEIVCFHDFNLEKKFKTNKLIKNLTFDEINKIAKKEIFGPVLCIIPFETEEEAITITNDTEYGLGNYIQTEDKEKAKRVAKKLRSGLVYINGSALDHGTPYGGYKQSGNGREGGIWGLNEFLEVKAITGWK